jgi:ABC-type transport system involved in multi-copper enzyme maturation permease subunit
MAETALERGGSRAWLGDVRGLADNPVYLLDGRTRFRRFRAFLLPLMCTLFGAGAVAAGFGLVVPLRTQTEFAAAMRMMLELSAYSIPGLPEGNSAWQLVMIFGITTILSLLVQIVAPIVGAFAFSREIERRTMPVLLTLPLSGRTITVGKVAACAYPTVLSGLCMVPLFALVASVADLGVWLATGFVVTMAISMVSRTTVGVCCSAYTRSSLAAVVWVILLVWIGLPIVQSLVAMPISAAYMVPMMGTMMASTAPTPIAMIPSFRGLTLWMTLATTVLDALVCWLCLALTVRRIQRLREDG